MNEPTIEEKLAFWKMVADQINGLHTIGNWEELEIDLDFMPPRHSILMFETKQPPNPLAFSDIICV